VLRLIEQPERRKTLIARRVSGAAENTYFFDIHLQGTEETVFFDV
jgi:protocatechuate 3,4-dioxygenase alpha subunit